MEIELELPGGKRADARMGADRVRTDQLVSGGAITERAAQP
jgi:hypothetical protein